MSDVSFLTYGAIHRRAFLMIFVLWKYVVSDWVYALHEWIVARNHNASKSDDESVGDSRSTYRGKWRDATYTRAESRHTGTRQQQRDRTSYRHRRAPAPTPLTPRAKYLRVLGLKRGAQPAEIKRAYRKLVKSYHPDRFLSTEYSAAQREHSAKKMRLLNEAYDWLEAHPL